MIAAQVVAIATQILPVAAKASVGPDVPAIASKIAMVAAEVASIAAKISSVAANVAVVSANLTRPLGANGRLRARDRRKPGSERQGNAECNQFIAKHLEILQNSVGTRPPIAPFEEVDEGDGTLLRASPYLAFREKDGIVPRRAGPTCFRGPSSLPLKGLRTNRGRSDSFADSE